MGCRSAPVEIIWLEKEKDRGKKVADDILVGDLFVVQLVPFVSCTVEIKVVEVDRSFPFKFYPMVKCREWIYIMDSLEDPCFLITNNPQI